MFNNILVVCVGNICRSPTAEYKLKALLPDKHIASAGINALVEKGADSTATEVAAQHGLNLQPHSARQLTADLCHQADLILVMEQGHIKAVTSLAPEARGKTMLLGRWLNSENGLQDIPDPYRQSKEAFEHVYRLIDAATAAWATKLA
ncbi:low molecular weight protein-tyrosine-phosphatase [Shewanella sp. Isolate11]|uniref:low molecular weight protein-tyrosine-phosphatase n=1 Tax=Shewanella sp. Isolate11 TaxID=2908530 RepID=UPI001EFE9610|nr:low molecular weight protein-tyrosine-phosphatase [Shewanella sp. Isolate11]MCG9698370.1 low molecular weight phosphotyrosine protein phosphatase [Shewanella sp. Isolate11]